MNITVVGGGRMGLPLACMFGKHGAVVTVADIDADLVALASTRAGAPTRNPVSRTFVATCTARTVDCDHRHRHRGRPLGRDRRHRAGAPDAGAGHRFPHSPSGLGEIGKGLQRGTLVVYETTVSVGGTRRKLDSGARA